WLSAWLRSPENAGLLAAWSHELVSPAVELLETSQLRNRGRDLIKSGIDSIAASPLAGRLLAVFVAQGQHIAAFDYSLEAAIEFLGRNKPLLRQKTAERASGWLPGWVDAKMADAFLAGLLDALAAARSADHSWRREYRGFVDGWIARLADDPEIYERG